MNDSPTIGILSDTHGLLRPEVEKALAGCDRILHAGDIGDRHLLERLQRIAPTVAVRGNMDTGAWSRALAVQEMVTIGGLFFLILHDRQRLDLEAAGAGIDVIVSGHTHQPEIFKKAGVTYINPGSAGHRRLAYPVSIALLDIKNGQALPRIVEIEP
ncbi:MAG: metallophosphoesterase family protein [Desulfosarcina sp.]|jgi:putative phosphoesterase